MQVLRGLTRGGVGDGRHPAQSEVAVVERRELARDDVDARGAQPVAVEVALAAIAETDDGLVYESADLIYHLMVLLAAKDVKFADVITELQKRHK